MLSECCWLASSLLAVCYRLLESVPAAVEDGLLRLCEEENSVLPPLGEELRPYHPLLAARDENKSST